MPTLTGCHFLKTAAEQEARRHQTHISDRNRKEKKIKKKQRVVYNIHKTNPSKNPKQQMKKKKNRQLPKRSKKKGEDATGKKGRRFNNMDKGKAESKKKDKKRGKAIERRCDSGELVPLNQVSDRKKRQRRRNVSR